MTSKLIVLPEAEADLRGAYDWYDLRRVGLGTEFLEEVDRCFARIVEQPFRPRPLEKGARSVWLRRFPFIVLYLPKSDAIVVLGVFHERRDPLMLASRLKKFE